MVPESEDETGLKWTSRLFIAQDSFTVFEWVEIPITAQLLDHIVYLYKLMQDNHLVSVEVEIAATWKLSHGWSKRSCPTTLNLRDNTAFVQTMVESMGDFRPNPGPGTIKEIEALVLPFSGGTEVSDKLQPLLDAYSDYIETPQCFGCTVNGVFELSGDERKVLLDSGCIDRPDEEVTTPDVRRWHSLQQRYFKKKVNTYLSTNGQPILSLDECLQVPL